MSINKLVEQAHTNAVEHGWWEVDRPFGELIALCHAELSEALEEYRNGKAMTTTYIKNDKPEGIPIELADVLIRIFDICGRYKIDLESAVKRKMAYNETRPHRHGGKVI